MAINELGGLQKYIELLSEIMTENSLAMCSICDMPHVCVGPYNLFSLISDELVKYVMCFVCQ
jgi:hypothetical protein